VRDKPAVIIDVRGNRGGNGLLGMHWLYNLIGEIVPTNCVMLLTGGMDGLELEMSMNSFSAPDDYFHSSMTQREFVNNHYIGFERPDRIVNSEQVLVILTDRATGSAGEIFVDLFTNMSNALIIGTPTSGTLTFSGNVSKYLPNSGMMLNFGRGKMLWPEGHFAEGVGFRPDIWADGPAIQVALALLRNAGLTE
jgi:C-terminal processing protease CtpA/Prc